MNHKLQHFELNRSGNDYVVGDLHGCYDQLMKQLRSINFDFDDDRLFCCGDMVDRGEDSLKTVSLLDTKWFFSVLGNHEYMISKTRTDRNIGNILMANGGMWFDLLSNELQTYVELLISKLPLLIEIETNNGLVGIVHATYPYDDWNMVGSPNTNFQQTCIWDRTLFDIKNFYDVEDDKFIVQNVHKVFHGHSITNDGNPVILGNRYYIDSGSFLGRELNIIKL